MSTNPIPRHFRIARHAGAALLATALIALGGCATDAKKIVDPIVNPPVATAGTTTFTGVFTGPTTSGKVVITVATTTLSRALRAPGLRHAAVTATGTLTPNGGAGVALIGTYDLESGSLSVSGGGYSIAAFKDVEFAPVALTGTFTGPSENGNVFCPAGDGTSVKVYIGAYQNDDGPPPTAAGSWNFIVTGTSLAGYSWPEGGTETLLIFGTVTGSTNPKTVKIASDTPDIHLAADGTLDTGTNHVTGTWTITQQGTSTVLDTGTWSGELQP